MLEQSANVNIKCWCIFMCESKLISLSGVDVSPTRLKHLHFVNTAVLFSLDYLYFA